MSYVTVNVDVDLDEFDIEDLVKEIIDRINNKTRFSNQGIGDMYDHLLKLHDTIAPLLPNGMGV